MFASASSCRWMPVWCTRHLKSGKLTPKCNAPSSRDRPDRTQFKAACLGTSRAPACQSASSSKVESHRRQPPTPRAGNSGCSKMTCEISCANEFARRPSGCAGLYTMSRLVPTAMVIAENFAAGAVMQRTLAVEAPELIKSGTEITGIPKCWQSSSHLIALVGHKPSSSRTA
jgi:hypothetical protein